MIGRLDTILADLRKFGFSLVTALLTASAFLGFAGTPLAIEARAAPFVAIMVLIATLSAPGPLGLLKPPTGAVWSIGRLIWILGVCGFIAALLMVYHVYRKRPAWLMLVIALGLGVWFTGGLWRLMIERVVVKSAAASWIVEVGALLAICVESYWVYVAWRSDMHRLKPREWPEGAPVSTKTTAAGTMAFHPQLVADINTLLAIVRAVAPPEPAFSYGET